MPPSLGGFGDTWMLLTISPFFCTFLQRKAHLRLKLPFFADSLLGAVHLYGPLSLETWCIIHSCKVEEVAGCKRAVQCSVVEFA